MPRFALATTTYLREAMEALGARRAFTDSAEFSQVSHLPLKIDEIIHKVRIEVDEEGTVAAAATAVFSFGPNPTPFKMRCNKPFAFCIVSLQQSPLFLFAGNVIDPGLVGQLPAKQSQSVVAPSTPKPRNVDPFSWDRTLTF
jgi:serpin B